MGWRLRLLVVAALMGCLTIFGVVSHVAELPHLEGQWHARADGRIELLASTHAELQAHQGQAVLGLSGADGQWLALDLIALERSPRWLASDALRERQILMQDQLAELLARGGVRLIFADGSAVPLQPAIRGPFRLGSLFWLLTALSLLLYLVGMVVLLARPSKRNLLYALMALCQAVNLFFMAVEALPGLGLAPGFARLAWTARVSADLLTGAAVLHAAAIHPLRLPFRSVVASVAWGTAATGITVLLDGTLPGLWWLTQVIPLAHGAAACGLLSWSYRIEPNPFAIVLRRFDVVGVVTLAMLTTIVAVIEQQPALQLKIATVGSVIWYVFLASLLLVIPFLSRSQQVVREFSMLAAISTVATSLDLLFVAIFSLGQFASLTLTLFLSLGAYAGARQWILNQMLGHHVPTAERMFEQLYRIAREVEVHPQRMAVLLTRLLRELFEPVELISIERKLHRARVVGDGSTLLVPVPTVSESSEAAATSLVLRFARRGKRMFTQEDARLCDRMLQQLRRAVAFDRAVEQGRSEERARIAQDLHDDIGARLLTLMYTAPTPEMEDYLRHTLQDLKTLTRGLAASNHRLTHAAAEWKADISQRLGVAQCQLHWTFSSDKDIVLTVVQWSALTRMLRELVSNTISHAQATQVWIEIGFEHDAFSLTVSDDGKGRDPQQWSHGLGLGGVRKRVKQLGGSVEWQENQPAGIHCQVQIPRLSSER
jgi:signal transduction histidine kinase